LLLLFDVVLEIVFDKTTIVSMVSTDGSTISLGFPLKIVFCCFSLLGFGGQLEVDVPVVGGTINKNGGTVVVILSGTSFGLRNQSWLAAFELVDMRATNRDFIKSTADHFTTFVGFPSTTMRLAYDATHALWEDCFLCCGTDGNVSL
jgi:hypothetical protein